MEEEWENFEAFLQAQKIKAGEKTKGAASTLRFLSSLENNLAQMKKDKTFHGGMSKEKVASIQGTSETLQLLIEAIEKNTADLETVKTTVLTPKYFDHLYNFVFRHTKDYLNRVKTLVHIWTPLSKYYRVGATFGTLQIYEKWFFVGYRHDKVYNFDSLVRELEVALENNATFLSYIQGKAAVSETAHHLYQITEKLQATS